MTHSTAPRFRHILLEHRFEADDVRRKLSEGVAFEELARTHSRCSSAANGGDLGFVALARLDPDFVEAATLLKVGDVSGIVRTRFGHHLIRREA